MNRIQGAVLGIIACAGLLSAQGQKLDGILAVVGDEIILQSELDAYSLLRMNAMNVKPDSFFVKEHRAEFLKDLIDGKVLLVHAKQDTTISVTDEDVDKALDNHIAMIMHQNKWTQAELEEQVKAQGMTFAKFKSETRKAIREQLYKQKVQQQYYYQIKAGRRDVEEFYNQYADSLPKATESVLLSKLTVQVTVPDSVRQVAFEKSVPSSSSFPRERISRKWHGNTPKALRPIPGATLDLLKRERSLSLRLNKKPLLHLRVK